MKIAVAGASGFIGKDLVEHLSSKGHEVIAWSRTDKKNLNTDHVSWRQVDLFSMIDIEKGLEGAECAVYLVHSMLPSAHLTQGNFKDFDLILADNFARAAQKTGIKHVVYLGGIIPDDGELSDHLMSRLEVEQTLRSYGLKVTALRAGVIIGKGGPSFQMIANLVSRLPVMICPSWTLTLSNPIYQQDVIECLSFCLENEDKQDKVYDIGGSTTVSYQELMNATAEKMGLKRFFFSTPFFSPKLSKLWVSTFTGAPPELVNPLIASLKHHIVPDPEKELVIPHFKFKNLDEMLSLVLSGEKKKFVPHAFYFTGSDHKEVRSVQRLTTLCRSSASKVSQTYFEWLPHFFHPFISVKKEGDHLWNFCFLNLKKPLLILKFSHERSTEDRQLFYIVGGLLAYSEGRGRLEFRNVLKKKYTIVAIHEFRPKLPWYLYKYTQALAHLVTMNSFNKFIIRHRL